MRWFALWLLVFPCLTHAQSSTVLPDELSLEVVIEETPHTPILGEMVLITIRGAYRRHITLEKLEQPDFDGFNWTQLGPDQWSDQRIDGRKVKILERRMALYPKRAGRLTIGAFVHHLTLTDEGDDWFEHDIKSNPVTIQVEPIPSQARDKWWFPTRSLRMTDQWSNAPDQLNPGEGVLRIIHLVATGTTPDMIPPMPELNSPSGMVFAHPEKRLVELSPDGPVTHAFWRWTLRPTNDVSAILEPLEVSYFDTTTRTHRTALISAQRVAYTENNETPPIALTKSKTQLPGWSHLAIALVTFLATLALLARATLSNTRWSKPRVVVLAPSYLRLLKAAYFRDAKAFRKEVHQLSKRLGHSQNRDDCVHELDKFIFSSSPPESVNLRSWIRPVLQDNKWRKAGTGQEVLQL